MKNGLLLSFTATGGVYSPFRGGVGV